MACIFLKMHRSILTPVMKNKRLIGLFKYSTATHLHIEELNRRTLIRLSGNEVSEFLQGLITNDMKHLETAGSMYTMFLNNKGRVLYDSIIYKRSEENAYFIECDAYVKSELQRHLKLYRVRRKVDIADMSGERKLWVAFDPNDTETDVRSAVEKIGGDGFDVYKDPRMSALGSRIIAPAGSTVSDVEKCLNVSNDSSDGIGYKLFRYRLGVGEGIFELPPGNCFPLESNCDYLHGVSFHKGCYIGQELTARTHHTGVVRKRLMPIHFESNVTDVPDIDSVVVTADEKESNIGKFRGVEKNAGIGLLRITQALQSKSVKIMNLIGSTMKPRWWPVEAPKEIASVGKN